MPFLRFVSITGKQKDRQPPWKGGESGAACLYGELLNICGCQEDVQPLRWSVPHWLLAPGSEVLLSGRFSTLPTLLRIFMLMMREIGERGRCGKRWNSVSLCCKRFKGSTVVDHAPPQKSSDIRLRIFYLQFVQNPHKETPFLSGTIRVQSGRTAPRELLPKTCKRRQE